MKQRLTDSKAVRSRGGFVTVHIDCTVIISIIIMVTITETCSHGVCSVSGLHLNLFIFFYFI